MKFEVPTKNLGEIVHHQKGFAFKSKDYQDSGVPVVRVTNFTADSLDDSELKYVNKSIAQINNRFMLKTFDVVIATVGSWPNNPASIVGKVIQVPQNLGGALLNQNSVILRVNDFDSGDQQYLFIALKSKRFSEYIVSTAQGSANQASITLSDIFNYEIEWPLKIYRNWIAKVVGNLDKKIATNRKTNETLEQVAQALFKSWFVDFDPVKTKAAGHKPVGMDEATAALFPESFEESELGLIPKGWEFGKIIDNFNLIMGQSPPGSSYNEKGLGEVFYQGRTDFGLRFPENRMYTTVPKRRAKKLDTLVSVRAPVGDINIAIEDCCIGRGLAAIRHKSGAYSFTYYLMKNMEGTFHGFESEGTVFGSINKTNFENIGFIKPDDNLIRKFEKITNNIDDKILQNSLQIQALTVLRNTLLPKLLSGEIDITEVNEQEGI